MIEMRQDFSVETDITDPNILPFEMVWIEPETVELGKHNTQLEDIEGDFHGEEDDNVLSIFPNMNVQINQGFWLGKFLVTNAQWNALSDFSTNYTEEDFWFMKNNAPKYGADWLEAMRFCRLLNILYQNELPEGYMFSLPTEIQWEYACKAGESEDYITSMDWQNIPEPEDLPLNNWGLHSMLFFVQWCYDIAAFYDSELHLNWLGNLDKDLWVDDSDSGYRMIRSIKNSVYREFTSYKNQACFRVCLRPIISLPNCDLNDPLLIEHGINMLGD